MIRRFIVSAAVVLGAMALLGGTADAAQNVACVWNETPLHLGTCVAI